MPLLGLGRLRLRLRLTLSYTVSLLVAVSFIGWFLLAALENSLLNATDEELRLRAAHLVKAMRSVGDEPLGSHDASRALLGLSQMDEFGAPGIYAQVRDAKGQVFAASPNLPGGELPVPENVLTAALAGEEVLATLPVGKDSLRMLAGPVTDGSRTIGVLLVAESLHPLAVTLRQTQQLLVLAAGVIALSFLLLGWWLTSRALGPVKEVTRVAREIAATGRFERRINGPAAEDEMGELAATFNEMLARLERTFRRQKEFLADASHELRGPLAVVRANLDLLKMDLPAHERKEGIREAGEELDRMAALVSDLLFLAETDAEEVVERRPVALDAVVAEVAERATALDLGRHEILLARNDTTSALGDRERLSQMLWNLVENALRYTPHGGQVTIALRRHGEVAELVVADTGIGIAPEQLPRIFERFYRVDPARSRREGGTGLGLAIVKQIAEVHHGQVRVRSEPGKGSVLSVVLPVASGANREASDAIGSR